MSDDFLDPRLAERLARAARAAQALSETLWETLHEELADPRRQRVTELSERLGEVAATVVSLARADAHVSETPAATVEPEPRTARVSESRTARTSDLESATREPSRGEPSTGEPTPPRGPFAPQGPLSVAVLVDELAPGEPSEIEIRDERGEGGPAAWIGAIGRRLERHAQDESPFAVLLVELVEIGRPGHAEPAGESSRLTSQVEDALARALRPADSLTRESPGRYWLLAPQTDGSGARMLAEQLARAVRSAASDRGAPVEVAIGIAVCPEDGRQASELAAHADVALYAARTAGRSA
ncbi:MAG TPA: diguanylate cyclase [Solirubrobacteraceae bacterium]